MLSKGDEGFRLKTLVCLLAMSGLVGCGGGGGGTEVTLAPGPGGGAAAASSTVSGMVSAGGASGAAARKAQALAEALITIEVHCKVPADCGQVKDDAASTQQLTVYKPYITASAVSDSGGGYTVQLNEPAATAGKLAAKGGYLVVTVRKPGYAERAFRIDFDGAPPATIAVPEAALDALNVQVVSAGSALTAADGRGVYLFGIVRDASGARRALAGRAYLAARKANGATTELEIAIPAGSPGVPSGSTLLGSLAAYDPSDPADAQRFPGAYADTQGNRLVSLGFDYINITDASGRNIGEAARAARAAQGARKAAIDWSSPTVITRYLPQTLADNLLRDSCTATYSEAIADPTSDCTALRTNRPDEWAGFNLPIYTYVPALGVWELFGIGTLVKDTNGNVTSPNTSSILTNEDVCPGQSSCPAEHYRAYARNNQIYVRIYVTNEQFQRQYWNLDYPLLFEQPVEYCVEGRVRDAAGNPVAGAHLSLYDDDSPQSFSYGSAASGSDGRYRITVARLSDDGDNRGSLYYYASLASGNQPANLGVSPNCTTHNIEVPAPGYVSGRVMRDNDGDGRGDRPVAGRTVWAYAADGRYAGAVTGTDGRFRMQVLQNNAYNYYVRWGDPVGSFNVNGTAEAPEETSDTGGEVQLADIVVPNDPPSATAWLLSPASQRAGSSGNASFRLQLWGYDADGDWPLTWALYRSSGSATAARAGKANNGCAGSKLSEGSFTQTSTSTTVTVDLEPGSHDLCLQVTDSAGQSATASPGRVEVVTGNRPPVIHWFYVWPTAVGICDARTQGQVSAYDLDGDSLTYAWTLNGSPQDCSGTACSFTLTGGGNHSVAVTVNDGQGGSTTREQTVSVANALPVITALTADRLVVPLGEANRSINATVTARDADACQTLRYTWRLGDTALGCSGTSCRFDLPNTAGTYRLSVTVSDGLGSASRSLDLGVGSSSLDIGIR